MTSRIGFVGVGRMGANMARRLKDKGYVITAVQDHNTAGAESLARELSCEAALTPARVAELSDVVLTVVTDDAAMDEIFSEESPSSLLCHAQDRLFINFATISPEAHMQAEHRVEGKGGTNIEALMASSITQAREGTLYLMCGGKKSVFEQARSTLEALSSKLLYLLLSFISIRKLLCVIQKHPKKSTDIQNIQRHPKTSKDNITRSNTSEDIKDV